FSEKRARKRVLAALQTAKDHAVRYKGLECEKLIVGMVPHHSYTSASSEPVYRSAVLGKQEEDDEKGGHQGAREAGDKAALSLESACCAEGRADIRRADEGGDHLQSRTGSECWFGEGGQTFEECGTHLGVVKNRTAM